MRNGLCSLRGIGDYSRGFGQEWTIKYSDQQNYALHAFELAD